MLIYFLSTLDVRAQMIEPKAKDQPDKLAILQEIRTGLNEVEQKYASYYPGWKDAAWSDAYRLERLLALLEPSDSLLSEVERRLDEADEEKVPSSPRLRKGYETVLKDHVDKTQSPPSLKSGAEMCLRSLLLDILEEIQWAQRKKYTARTIQKKATYKIIIAAVFSFLLFISPYILAYIALALGYKSFIESWSALPLWTALTAGLFGAFFSRLLYLQSNWNILSLEELKDAREFASIFLRGMVGMSGATVVYFFLQSNVIGGELFPDFEEIAFFDTKVSKADPDKTILLRLVFPNAQLALLVVWSFLSGFSERLIPSILQSAESSLGQSVGKMK
jgi:hypothetical protein